MTRMGVILFLLGLLLYPAQAQKSNPSAASGAARPYRVVEQVHAYRLANEHRIVRELTDLLAIPNVASDTVNIQRNAAKLAEMLEQRGIQTQLLPIPGRGPVVFGRLDTPGATRTVIFYLHYDGQPVNASEWADTKPFEPALRNAAIQAGGKLIPFPAPPTPYEDEWRLYARSAADDKGPIVVLLAALDALHAQKIPVAANLKILLDGEEENGSPNLECTLLASRATTSRKMNRRPRSARNTRGSLAW